jgi:glycosyltransferase involved in cell wall biosynthesis
MTTTPVDERRPITLREVSREGHHAPEGRMLSVVVPVYNEQHTVRPLYDELVSALASSGPWEVVFVDDGSTDASFAELTRLHERFGNVRVVRMRRNFGKSAALAAGFERARGEVIVTIDGDLQDEPLEIPTLLAKLDEGFDLVSGWKTDRQDSLPRRLFSKVYNGTTAWVSGVHLHDMNCGLKAYRAEVVRDIRLYGELHRYLPVLAHQRGYRVAEVPVHHRRREHGKSRYGLERYARGFFDLLTVTFMGRYRNRPLHLFGGVGLAMGFLGFLILCYLTALKIGGAGIGERPLLLLGALFVVVGVQLFSLGLVGEMIANHRAENNDRRRGPTYVRETLD